MARRRTKKRSACPYCDSPDTERLPGRNVLECLTCGSAFGDAQVTRYVERGEWEETQREKLTSTRERTSKAY
ncbi:MAG: hypothetical protein MN733_18135 [Nitrososphaera sp.]|nr:hypothetical protein [Nitrososphaera sp.]